MLSLLLAVWETIKQTKGLVNAIKGKKLPEITLILQTEAKPIYFNSRIPLVQPLTGAQMLFSFLQLCQVTRKSIALPCYTALLLACNTVTALNL